MEKIIFLDIDGVLCVDWMEDDDEYGHGFRKEFVENLKTIIDETGAKIVMSSSWRIAGLKRMQAMWEMRDLPGKLIDVTPSLWTKRGEEIENYLIENPCDKYVILDDDTDFLDEQKPFFVKTSCNKHEDSYHGMGLTKQCSQQAIKILND